MKHINRIFFTFLIAYAVLIIIPLFTGIIMNRAIVREYEQHVKQSHLSNLNKTQEVLEGFMEDIKWSTYQLAGNSRLLRLISDDDIKLTNMERSILIRETMQELRKSLLYNASNNSIFYIYLKNQDLIITPYSVYRHSDFNSSINFFKMEGISSSAWHDHITNSLESGIIYPVRETIIEDFKNKPMIPYVQSIPIDGTISGIDGAIVYLIGETDFIKFLEDKSLPEGAYSYISDHKNNIIVSVSNSDSEIIPLDLEGDNGMIELMVNDENQFIIYTTSEKNSWKYVSVIPVRWVLKSVRFYQFLSFTVMFIALVFCLGAAYIISQKWSKPLITSYQSIQGFLKTDCNEKESFESLNLSVNELIDKGEDMQDEILNQKYFVHNAFVNRLINGFFNNETNLARYLAHLGFNLTESSFSVAILSLVGITSDGSTESFDEINRVKNIVKSKLQFDFKYRIMMSEQGNSDIVLIILTDNICDHMSNIRVALDTFILDLPPLYKDNLIVGLGKNVNSLMSIHKSFIQAQEAVSSNHDGDTSLIYGPEDIDKKQDHYYYPLELESRLINTLKSGDCESMAGILGTLFQENIEHRILDKKRLKAFYANLLSSLYRVKSQLCSSNQLDIEEFDGDGKLNFDDIQNMFNRLCIKQNDNKKSHNNLLIDKIKEFLEFNFSDNNLSLNAVGEHFSITESYLSFFFKEQTGINFSTYLEEIRVNEGKNLLLTTNLAIREIASEVGYNSDKTFRRVFQKNINFSPSKFRSENRGN